MEIADLADAIMELRDRQAITDVMIGYADSADRCDFDRIVSECFHEDAVYVYGKGADPVPVRAFFAQAKSEDSLGAGFVQTMHYLTNVQVRLSGDEAMAQSYILAQHRIAADAPDRPPHFPNLGREYGLLIGARYLDRFAKRKGLWRITRRQLDYEWNARIEPSTLAGPLASRRKLVPSELTNEPLGR